MKDVAFATPLSQSIHSSILEYHFPKPHHQYVLIGRSRAAWHTSFVIPQLNLLLDAGLCVNKSRPKHIFLTHGHSDHTLLSPAFVNRDDPPDIYCPAQMRRAFDDFILGQTMLDKGGDITIDDAEAAGLDVSHESTNGYDDGRSPNEKAWLNTHHTHGLHDGDVVFLPRSQHITATAFACDHSVPSLGYLFSSETHRLKPEYTQLSGPEIRDLRQSGQEITTPHSTPIFAFLGDTTAATLAADPEWLQNGVSVVITECSFLYEEHRSVAERTKHTIWRDLEPVIRNCPRTTFVLMHFSLRYSDAEVAAYFRALPDCPTNIVLWVDGDPE